jgi:O-antigen/teichoic acid export membrane protein
MQDNIALNNKRIAKNTIYLYIRMFVTMSVGFYTTRIVLQILGVSDYGIYNVMGGIVGMLSYVNSLLSGGIARFLTFALGCGGQKEVSRIFAISNTLCLIASIIFLILGESIGLWFMNTQLNIDPFRMEAAGWVYQCALFSCCLTVLQTPYTALIIAHERMNIYAFMSVFDVSMKLFVVFLLIWGDYDKLKLFAVFMLFVTFLNLVLYRLICMKLFSETTSQLLFNRVKFKEMISYSGWNMVGALAIILNNYGLNILLNIFFGTIVNAARGIAMQVSHIVKQFYTNFQMASYPQITKYYAQGDIKGMSQLICNSSKYCSLLLLCLIIPIVFNIDDFLYLWLGQVPSYTAWFIRLIMLQILYISIDEPIGMGIHAVGRMRLPNLTSAFFYLSVFPLTWLAFKLGAGPISGYCIYMAFTPFILLVDLIILRSYSGFSIHHFFINVLIPVSLICICGSLVSAIIIYHIPQRGLLYFFMRSGLSFFSICIIVWIGGLTPNIRKVVLCKLHFIQ